MDQPEKPDNSLLEKAAGLLLQKKCSEVVGWRETLGHDSLGRLSTFSALCCKTLLLIMATLRWNVLLFI